MIQNLIGAGGTNGKSSVKKIIDRHYYSDLDHCLTLDGVATGIPREKIKGLYIQQATPYYQYFCVWAKESGILETGKISTNDGIKIQDYTSAVSLDADGTLHLKSYVDGSTNGDIQYNIYVYYDA